MGNWVIYIDGRDTMYSLPVKESYLLEYIVAWLQINAFLTETFENDTREIIESDYHKIA